jgi:hypothetical protein
MDAKEVERGDVDWINLGLGKVVDFLNSVINIWVS